jgi:hypothetical protein
MPVTTEQNAEKTRRRGRPWLGALLGLGALLLLLPLVPLVHPVSLTASGHVAVIWTERQPGVAPPGSWTPVVHSVESPLLPVGTTALGGRSYQHTGTLRARVLYFAGWTYCVAWFKGRRLK